MCNNQTLPPYLYHVTSPLSTWEIMKKGLIPQIGTHTEMNMQTKPAVFLCEKKDVPYWAKLLGKNTALRIDTDKLDKDLIEGPYQYTNYSEYLYGKPIPVTAIAPAKFKKLTPEQEKKQCLEYIYTASHACEKIARYYLDRNIDAEYKKDIELFIESAIPCMLYTAGKMDFSLVSEKDMRDTVRKIADGGFPFTDRCDFQNENCRLYEKLTQYGTDRFSGIRLQLHDFIKNTFAPVLDMDTGGWIM